MAEKDKNQHDNADQEQHQGEDANKPWETLFDDDRDDQGNLSRVATRKKRQGSSKLTWILAILLILAVLAPIIYYKVMDNQGSSGGNLSNDKVVIQSAKKTSHSAKSSKTSKTSKTSAKEASSSQQATSAQASSQVSQAPSASQNQEQASASAAPSQASTAGNSYTVKSGDNLYRIAVNHNMTLDELLQLNGLSANSGITPGTVLKVK